ncbi:MAG: hypothetical protein EOQ50_14880 [Mesorhizobium sp.]|uniref:HTH domain-containing protein n=1 Tax=Mesorhizobium sp. TaxID=1871066 RepID=UPI000FE7F2AA|nr:restriction endonuclease [Mesorhizobium sp.]RWB74595.1 MAG: hypothetical protein EOQ50_14880 [Mesorhizobium sp.]
MLPFLGLSWEDFERLCRRLAEASGDVERAWAYGTRGQKQYGIDLLVRRTDDSYEVWQTKRYKKAIAGDVAAALEIFLKHPWAEKAKRFVLVFACALEETKVVESIEDAGTNLSSKGIGFDPLDAVRLTQRLIPHPEIVDDFFGRSWVEKVCPREALTRLAARIPAISKDASTAAYYSPVNGEDHRFAALLSKQEQILDGLTQAQANLATKDDVAAVARSLQGHDPEPAVRLPRTFADRELQAEYSKALRRRGFSRTDTPRELATLAVRAIDGDLALASPLLRAEVCDRAARANALPETRAAAERFRSQAATLDPTRDLFVLDAYLKEAAGNADAALLDLKTRDDIEARSAVFFILVRERGTSAALEWARAENFKAADFTPPSALNLVIKTIENGDFDEALTFVQEIPSSYFDEIAALYLLRAQLVLASLLPQDRRAALFQGLPVNPRILQFASGSNADSSLKAALADVQILTAKVQELGIDHLVDFLSELALWLRLEIPDQCDGARRQLTDELAEPKTILQRVRLALAYGVPFEKDALQRSLVRRKELGGWSPDERFAAFLLAVHDGDENTINAFFEAHREDLFAQNDLSLGYLATLEVEALARSGRVDDARQLLNTHRGKHLTDDQAKDAEEAIVAIANQDEVEWHRQRYEQSKNLQELQLLVGGLRARCDTKLLAEYSPRLVRETRTRDDFDVAIKSLYGEKRDVELIELCNELPDQTRLDPEYEAIKAWSLYRIGRVVEARAIARKLFSSRGEASDRELVINTSVETGDWGYLQGLVAREMDRLDNLSPKDCIRMARLCLEIASPYVNQFRDAAITKAPNDPHVFLSAYVLATERGEEDQEPRAHEWLQKAIELSGADGPVQSMSFRGVIEQASGWRERTSRFEKALREAEIPVFIIARTVNRHLLDLTLGQSHRNLNVQEGRVSYPVFAFSGARTIGEVVRSSTVALDVTALITLEYLGLLEPALAYFKQVIISPRTLGFLFAERQFIRVQQPSKVAKALRIQSLIASGRLKTVPRSVGHATAAGNEMGGDLFTLIETASASGGLVVRTAPVSKLGSYLEEVVDMDAFKSVLTDTHRVMSFLSSKIDSARRNAAEPYLRQVDQGWPEAQPIETTSTLYLDDLSVAYLDHVGVLDSLTSAVTSVYVHEDVAEQAQATLRHAEAANRLLTAIDEIRRKISAEVESGRIAFSARHVSERDEGDDEHEDPTVAAPTLDLLSDLADIDVVVADDRCLNKMPNWSDGAGRTVPCATTLDVLASLRRSGRLSEDDYWLARHRLRAGGFYAVPLEADELLYWLGFASSKDGRLEETPELRAIRESIALPQIHATFLPPEDLWLAGIRLAIYRAVRQTWSAANSAKVAATRADWLMSILPDPMTWCLNPDNQPLWSTARQQAGMQTAMFLVFTEGRKGRRGEYFSWAEERLVDPIQKYRPEIWDATIEFLKSYIARLWMMDGQADVEISREALTELLLNPLPLSVRMPLLLDEEFRAKLGLKPRFSYPLGKQLSVETGSLHDALRAAIRGRASAMITLSDGQRVRGGVSRLPDGKAGLVVKGERFSFSNADLLSGEREARIASLQRIFSAQPLSEKEERHWHKIAEDRALDDSEYDELMTTLGYTPEAFAAELQKPQSLSRETMLPDVPAYFDRLVAPLGENKDIETFIRGDLTSARRSLLERNPAVAVRRIAFTALWQPLIPFDQLEGLAVADLSPLLDAEDPFTLLFGFEMCRALLHKDSAFVDLGSAFLRKLFGDAEASEHRNEMFSACAIVATIEIRRAAKAASAPVFWTRLAALAHAGVLANALGRMPDTVGFLGWVTRNFYPHYVWSCIVDRPETPRWCPDWISPDHIFAELVGRARGAFHMLAEPSRPGAWVELIDAATARLADNKGILMAMFPGPFDDFLQMNIISPLREVFAEVEMSLDRARRLADVPGFAALTYASIPSERAINNVTRILTVGVNEPIADIELEVRYLRLAAHFALAGHSEVVAQAVIDRCFVIAHGADVSTQITDLFAVIMEASAVYRASHRYHEVIGEYAARICFLVNSNEALASLGDIFDVLVQRDERLTQVLGKARAINLTIRNRTVH